MDYIHPDDRDRVRADLATVYAKTNRGVPFQYRIRKADGEYLWVESVATNLVGVEGVDGVVTTTRRSQNAKKQRKNSIRNMRN